MRQFRLYNIKKVLLVIGMIVLFCGCIKEEIRISGTKWKSVGTISNGDFIYIHFKDNSSFEYCLVDYDLYRLSEMQESSYIRMGNTFVSFSENNMFLRSANFNYGTRNGSIVPIRYRTKEDKRITLTLDATNSGQVTIECEKINRKPKG